MSPMLGRKVIESRQLLPILGQLRGRILKTLENLVELRKFEPLTP